MVALATFFMTLFQVLVVHASEPSTTTDDESGDNVMRVYLFNEEGDSVLVVPEEATPALTLMAKGLEEIEVRSPAATSK